MSISGDLRLHSDGRTLIGSWVKKASQESDVFERFIFLWFAFNGWAACVTQFDRDSYYLKALGYDEELKQRFVTLARTPSTGLQRAIGAFENSWPIFKVQALRKKNIELRHAGTRREVVE